MQKFTILVFIFLLITAIFDLDIGYWYFQLLRWIIFVCACLNGYLNYQNKKLLIAFSIIAILFNPIAPVYFTKEIWKILDGVAGLVFLFTLFQEKFK